jgi:putative oxidoreductase
MFIAHYSGHVLAGPEQFQVFASYFSGVGFHIGGPMVVLAGVIEIVVSIGLVFGLATRLAATSAILYLYFATLWGEHFSAGYIWVLPNGGWEFSALWMVVILVFIITGGSKISIDRRMETNTPKWLNWCFR